MSLRLLFSVGAAFNTFVFVAFTFTGAAEGGGNLNMGVSATPKGLFQLVRHSLLTGEDSNSLHQGPWRLCVGSCSNAIAFMSLASELSERGSGGKVAGNPESKPGRRSSSMGEFSRTFIWPSTSRASGGIPMCINDWALCQSTIRTQSCPLACRCCQVFGLLVTNVASGISSLGNRDQ